MCLGRDVSSTRKHRDKPNFLSFSLPAPEHHQTAATMTEAEALEKKQRKSNNQNGDVLPEATREDVFDHTYKEKAGPKPGTIIVWKNVILMTVLHIGALYAVSLIPSASPLTLLWCKYKKILPVTAFLLFFLFFFISLLVELHTVFVFFYLITSVMSAARPTLSPLVHA